MIHEKYEAVVVEMLPEELVRLLASCGIAPGWDARDVEITKAFRPETGQVYRFRFERQL